jgi:hypothetical protein
VYVYLTLCLMVMLKKVVDLWLTISATCIIFKLYFVLIAMPFALSGSCQFRIHQVNLFKLYIKSFASVDDSSKAFPQYYIMEYLKYA